MNKNYNRLDPGGSQSHSARKYMHWLLILVIAQMIDPIQGELVMNGGEFDGFLDPGLVNSESSITIASLYRDTGGDEPYEFKSGDCFQIQFSEINDYDSIKAGHYIPVPNAITECAFNVATTCEKFNDFIVKLTLGASTSDLVGTIGKIKNPYSQVDLPLKQVYFYQNCVNGAPSDQLSSDDNALTFVLGSIPTVTMDTSTKIVGYSGSDNVASFTFTPATSLSPIGGEIHIVASAWFTSTKFAKYPFGSGFECSSTSFTEITKQSIARSGSKKKWEIKYAGLVSTVTESSPITVNCRRWINPTWPQAITDFVIITTDANGKEIDESTPFTLDASAFTPYQSAADSVTFTIGSKLVQQETTYLVEFKSEVPLEIGAGGCYIKYIFPKELQISTGKPGTFTGAADNLMLTSSGGTNLIPVDSDLTSPTGKFVTIQGCTNEAMKSQIATTKYQTATLTFTNIRSPYAVKDTSAFKIEVYKTWSGGVYSQQIIETPDAIITKDKYESGQVQQLIVTADNNTVQEHPTHKFEFEVQNIIPGTQNTDIQPAFHIRFPSTFIRDPDNAASNAIIISSVDGSFPDTPATFVPDVSLTYDTACQLILCYVIEFNLAQDILAGKRVLISIANLENPESIFPCGTMHISSMMKYTGEAEYSKIDSQEIASGFTAVKGIISPSTMRINSETGDLSTYANNQAYILSFTSVHKIFQGGYIKVKIPDTFKMSSESTAVALFYVRNEAGDINYAVLEAVSASGLYIMGNIQTMMPKGQVYKIRIGGLQNPRYIVSNAGLPVPHDFIITTYDVNGRLGNPINMEDNIVDVGTGAAVDITKVSLMDSFSVEAFNTTNGVSDKYFITWNTNILTVNGDKLIVTFPIQTKLSPTKSRNVFDCTGKNGITKVSCYFENKNPQQLIIEMEQVTQETGLYKVQVENITNPPSLYRSDVFGDIYQTTSAGQKVAEFTDPIKLAQVYIQNEYASELQGLSASNIRQSTDEYDIDADYIITFTPYSRPQQRPQTLFLSYPISIKPTQEMIDSGCQVTTSRTTDRKLCKKIEGARLFKITGAIPARFDKSVEIKISFKNPLDNWGEIGFKIKTMEEVGDETYLVDQLEGNELIPILKCFAPCQYCYETLKGGGKRKAEYDKNYCTQCWQTHPLKYLQTYSPWDKKGNGKSTCLGACEKGYTTNGDKEKHVCVDCHESCAECQDNGFVGDNKKCRKCSQSHKMLYSPDQSCMKECGVGFYQVSKDKQTGFGNCDKCKDLCLDCAGDKFNCTKCNPEKDTKALFISKNQVGKSTTYRGSCKANCPSGYFMDEKDKLDIRCNQCKSPCSTCETTEDYCLSCNGENNQYYSYNGNCYEECPKATSPDLSNLKCLGCPPNCNKCGTLGKSNCYECAYPWLLEEGQCRKECQQSGYYANSAGTMCINKTEFPWLGPFFTYISVIIIIAVLISKKFKKETEIIPSLVAMISFVEFFAIWFQIWMAIIFETKKQLYFTLVALIVLIILNVVNYFYVKNNVMSADAMKKVRLSQKKVKEIYQDQEAKDKRRKNYEKAMAKHEAKKTGKKYVDPDRGQKAKKDPKAKDAKQELKAETLEKHGIEKEGEVYYQYKSVEDKGFNKWYEAYEDVGKIIRWISLGVTFKFYRMTYSYFMGRKCFLVLYQKKKFKKQTVLLTLVSQFFVELMLIIADIMAVLSLPPDQQIQATCMDTLMISVFLILIEFVEIARLDKIMKTRNTAGHRSRKSAAACESSDEQGLMSTEEESEEDDYPDWRQMLKHVEGNPKLFNGDKTQVIINNLEKRFDQKIAESMFEYQDELEEDPRKTRSFPTSPKGYREFDGVDFGRFGNNFDNVYADSKAPAAQKKNKEFSEMGTQAQPSEILSALARKGGDLITPGVDKEDYSRRKTSKKKRGRKNKYYRQIDAEDDEEADNMSDGSDEDGLDGIKEEDEEDEEERLAREAKLRAEHAAKEEDKKKEEEYQRQKKEAEEAAIRALNDKKAQEAADKKRAEEEAAAKKKADEEAARRKAEQDAADALRRKQEEEEAARLAAEAAAKKSEEEKNADAQSDLSGMMVKSNALQNFGQQGLVEVPPNAESRRFNECDIIGDLDRDEKGNVLANQDENTGQFLDKNGKPTNERGYLTNPATGDVINNLNGDKMFDKKELDDKGELPAPFNVEKHNFNPHQVRGDFEYDKNGLPIIKKDSKGAFVDKRGSKVSSRGYRVDSAQGGNIIDNNDRKKFDKNQATADGDLPKLFNYNGRRFDIVDTIGQFDKDSKGNIIPLTDQNGNLIDNLGRRVNSRGYLIDEFGNVIDKDGRQLFENQHLMDDEIPKIFPFTKFNIKNVLGDFEMDPLGNPILDRDADGNFIDRQGRRCNSKGYLIDKDGNVINKNGKMMFKSNLLDNEGDIPKVFRTGLLKSDTASSLSRLMSEIGKNQPSEFDMEEQRIQDEIAKNMRNKKRGNSGNTSVDSMMEDTPANYNYQNQRFDPQQDMEGEDQEDMDDDDEYGSQYDQVMGQTGFTHGGLGGVQELAKKKRKKKKKKKKKKPQEMEDPSLREHLLAGAYGGIAKPKPKRQGVKYTTDLNAGLRDIATPASAFMRDPSKKNIMTSLSGFHQVPEGPDSSRGKRRGRGFDGRSTNRLRSSQGRSEIGSNIGSRIGGLKKTQDSAAKLLDPQQREDALKQAQMEEIMIKKQMRIEAKKKKLAAGGKPGKISKDADFEKMFGKDIDEFLEDSEWDIESIDKMSQFSKGSKNTIRSAAQANKLRGLEKLYLQRIETSMNKNTLQMTAGQAPNAVANPKQPKKGKQKFREFQDRYVDDPAYISRGLDGEDESPAKRQAWETGSRMSRGSRTNQSVSKVFKGKK